MLESWKEVETSPTPGDVRLPPILDLLSVRYLICSAADDTSYFVAVNHSALPRVFVPRSVEVITDARERLSKLASAHFDPREVAYVSEDNNPVMAGRGDVRILDETPQRIVTHAQMEQGGLIVLADRWDSGWRASIGGKRIPIVHVDHAVRGVIAPQGESTIVFQYQPVSLRIGVGLAVAALIFLCAAFLLHRRALAS